MNILKDWKEKFVLGDQKTSKYIKPHLKKKHDTGIKIFCKTWKRAKRYAVIPARLSSLTPRS